MQERKDGQLRYKIKPKGLPPEIVIADDFSNIGEFIVFTNDKVTEAIFNATEIVFILQIPD